MKRFRFPLETLRTLRRRKLEKLEAELAAVHRRRTAALDRAAALETRSAATREAIQTQGTLRGADLRLADAASQAMLEQARAARDTAHLLERDVAKAREAVLKASGDAEALDRLRERSMREWREAVEREEEALAAELYLARHGR